MPLSPAMQAALDKLPSAIDVEAERAGKPLPKGKSRLEQKAEAKPLTKVDEKAFKAEVWTRDEGRCRKCARKVLKTLARVPERGEVHHLHGRRGDLRFEAKSAILTCATCHEQLTGRVSEKWVAVPATKGVWWWSTHSDGTRWIDARKRLRFERVA